MKDFFLIAAAVALGYLLGDFAASHTPEILGAIKAGFQYVSEMQ